MELNSSNTSKQQIINTTRQQYNQDYKTSNFKYPDTFLFTSEKSSKVSQSEDYNNNKFNKNNNALKPNIMTSLKPRYFDIDNKNSDFTKEINPQFKCNILICRGCGLLIGYKSFIVAKKKYFLTLSALLNYKIDPEADDDCFLNVFCTGCNEELGIKVKNSYYLYSVMVCEKNRIITCAIISLKKELNDEFEILLKTINQQLNLQITIHHFNLQKSQLMNFKLQFNYDICILIHKEEGRLLLFNDNGLYHSLYQECYNNTKGNVLFVLLMNEYHTISGQFDSKQNNNISQDKSINNNNNSTENNISLNTQSENQPDNKQISKTTQDDKINIQQNKNNNLDIHQINSNNNHNFIWDKQFIKELSENGKQPLLYLLSKNQLVITIVEQINIFQINFIMNFLHNSQYKPLVPGELKIALDFKKIYLKIKIEKCQSAIFSYFMEESEQKGEYNDIIKSLEQQNLESDNKKYKEQNNSNHDETIQSDQNKNESDNNNSNQKCIIF